MNTPPTEEIPPEMLPPGSLLRLAKRYFPVTLTDSISPICQGCLENQCKDGIMEEHAQQVLDKLHQEIKMFESPTAMLTALQTYQAFTTSHWFFNKDICESYNRIFQEHKSLKKETYIQKNTLFALLQEIVFHLRSEMREPLPRALLALFLKTHEKKLLGTLEFIKWSDDETRRIQNLFYDEFKRERSKFINRTIDVTDGKTLFRNTIPGTWDSEQYKTVDRIMEEFYKGSGFVDLTPMMNHLIPCTIIFNALGNVIANNPFIFFPASETPHIKKPKIVRIFVDHGNKFVMRTEIAGIQECHENEYLATIDAKLALKLALEHTAKGGEPVEFIPTEITRTKHRTVPIQTPDGKLCKLAVDVLFELLQDLIFEYRVFQDTSEFYWSQVVEFLDRMNEYFPSDTKDPYFLDMETIEKIDQMAREKFSTDFPAPADKYAWKTKREQHRIATLHIDRRLWRNTSFEKRSLDSPVFGKLSDVIQEDMLYFCHIEFPNLAQFIHNQDGCWRFPKKKCCGVPAPAPEAPRGLLDDVKAPRPLRGKPSKQYLKSLDKWINDMYDKLGWVEDVKPIPKKVNVHEKVLYKPRIKSRSVKRYRMRVTMKKRAARAKAPKLNLPSPPQEPLPSTWCRIYLPEKSVVNLDGTEEREVMLSKALEALKDSGDLKSVVRYLCQTELAKHVNRVERETEVLRAGVEKLLVEKSETIKELEGIIQKQREELRAATMKTAKAHEMSSKIVVLMEEIQSDRLKERTEHRNVQEELKQAKSLIEKMQAEKKEQQKIQLEKDRKIEKMQAEKEEQQKIQMEKDRKTAMVHRTVLEGLEQMKVGLTTMKQEKEVQQATNQQIREQLTKEQSTRKRLEQENAQLRAELLERTVKPEVDMKSVLKDLQDQRDKLKKDDPMGEAKQLANKLIGMTLDGWVKQRTRKELEMLSKKYQDHLAAIEKNIETIQNNPLIVYSQLIAIPELPGFSKTFFEDYEKTRKALEVKDLECLICLDDVGPTTGSRKSDCSSCKKVFHKECLNNWKQRNPVCPHCRRTI